MLFKNVTIINSSFKSEPNMYVATTNDKIDYVGNEYISGYGDEFDGNGYLLCPAFYNVHAHSAMTLLRGIGEDLPLSQWLNTKIFPAESTLCGEDVYYGTLLAIAEMLAHGTASCSDMYFFSNYAASAYSEAQFKCNISPNSVCFDENEHFQDSSVFADYEKLLERYAKSPLIRLDATLHSEYATTPRFCAEVAKYALLNKLGMHVHVSETFGEHAQCVATRKKTPTAYFDSLGVFDVRATAAHCVYVTDDDLKILSKKNVSIATNPQSNLKLGSGIADYKSISDTKINLAVGTDGAASNNSLNLLKEARLLALLAKGTSHDSSLFPTSQALYAATRGGAIAQGRTDCGVIAQGMKADIAVYDLNTVGTVPSRDAATTLLYSCEGGAYMTMVDGKILFRNGEYSTIDIEKVKYYVNQFCKSCK